MKHIQVTALYTIVMTALFSLGLVVTPALAIETKVKPEPVYLLSGSTQRYPSLEELISNVNQAEEIEFQNCISADTYSCYKAYITDAEPSQYAVLVNGEYHWYILHRESLTQTKLQSDGPIQTTTNPNAGSLGANVSHQCPSNMRAWGYGPSENQTVECILIEEQSCPDTGNPINIGTGDKFEHETDYSTADGMLKVERFYINQYSGWVIDSVASTMGVPAGAAGQWQTLLGADSLNPFTRKEERKRYSLDPSNPYTIQTYDYTYTHPLINPTANDVVYLAVGRQKYRFVKNASGGFDGDGINGLKTQLVPIDPALSDGAIWKFVDERGNSSFFLSDGKPIRKEFISGGSISYHYGPEGLASKQDHLGRTITYNYDIHGRIISITQPDGQNIVYHYGSDEENIDFWLLQRVSWPDGTSIGYVYNEPEHIDASTGYMFLTGKTDTHGQRIGTYKYYQGKAVFTEGPLGSNQRTLTISSSQATVINSLDARYTYSFQKINGHKLLAYASQPAGSGCTAATAAAQYYTNGLTKYNIDFNGWKTLYGYDQARALETVRVEGLSRNNNQDYLPEGGNLPINTRKISTQWHSTWRKPIKKAEPNLVTTFIYNGDADPFTGQTAQCAPNSLPLLCHLVRQATTDGNGAQGFSATIDSIIAHREWFHTYNDRGQLLTLSRTTSGSPEQIRGYYENSGDNWTIGDLQSITNALGQTIQFTQYDRNGRLLKMTDVNGVETLFTYDARGRLTSQSIAGATTTHTYDLNGNRITSTLPNNVTVSYEYDPAKRLTAIVNSAGDKISYEYDTENNLRFERVLNSSGTITYTKEHVYDALSRVQNTLNSSAQGSTFLYDAEGNLKGEVDANQHSIQNTFDASDRVTKSIDALNGQTFYTYNAQGHITSVKDPEGLITHYTYNAFGDLIEQASPDTGTTTFTYDNAGNRTSATDSRGVIANYTYDALNRLTTVSYPASPTENVTYTYDDTTNGNYGIGRLTGMSNASGTTSYIYNALGLVVQKQSTVHGVNSAILYNYDLAGNITSITYPSGRVVNYQRDSLGRVTVITTQSPGQTTAQTLLSNIGYLPFGPANSYVYGNGLSHAMTYDLDYRLTHIEVDGINPILERAYSYDPVNNISGITNGVDTGKSQTFQYDALDRLTQANGFYGLLTYTYDGVGNRLTSALDDGTDQLQETYSYATQSHRLLGVDSTVNGTPDQTRQFTYDAAGNPQQRHSESGDLQDTTHNAANRLSTVAVNGTPTATYSYNALGQRVSKVLASGTTEHYHYNEAGQLIAVTNGTGAMLREHIYFDSQKIALVEVTGQIYYIHNDHLATPQVATDANQQVVWMADYQPFGKVSESINTINLYSRFPGQYEDEETGLYYNYFRDYDPSLGRYLQSDPIGLEGGINTYAYVSGNPVRLIDPWGLSPDDVARIKDIYRAEVNRMTERGHRTSPWRNNIRRNVESFFNGGKLVPYDPQKTGHYLQCHEQAEQIVDTMETDIYENADAYDDYWVFDTVDNGVGDNYSHTWGRARSDNPTDPVIIFDPFFDTVTESSCGCNL